MIGVLRELEQRRTALQERSSAQRILIAEATAALAARGMVLDRAVAVARGLAARPLLFGSVITLALLLGRRRVFSWIGRTVTILGVVRGLISALRNPHP